MTYEFCSTKECFNFSDSFEYFGPVRIGHYKSVKSMCFTEFRFSSACLDEIIIVSLLCDLSAKSRVGTI